MNTQRTFNKGDIIVTDIEYRASANGDGIIYLNLENGTIEVDVEGCFDRLDYANYSYSYTTETDVYSYYYLDDTSIEAVWALKKSSLTIATVMLVLLLSIIVLMSVKRNFYII